MNDTIRRFGHPATLVADYPDWVVLLRPEQPTLASLVLAHKGEERAFGALAPRAFTGLGHAIADIERALRAAVDYERINYLMLMMVDPHVHFHVVPRYDGVRTAGTLTIADAGWPKAPALNEAVTLDGGQIAALVAWLREAWPAA